MKTTCISIANRSMETLEKSERIIIMHVCSQESNANHVLMSQMQTTLGLKFIKIYQTVYSRIKLPI